MPPVFPRIPVICAHIVRTFDGLPGQWSERDFTVGRAGVTLRYHLCMDKRFAARHGVDKRPPDRQAAGTCQVEPFPLSRTPTMDVVQLGMRRHQIPVLLEVDVTDARAALARRRRETGEEVSFTAWAVKCVAQAAAEHKRVHALRRGRRKLVLFDEVDVGCPIYRRVGGDEMGERLPLPFLVRRADRKPVEEISRELREAQIRPLAPGQQTLVEGAASPPQWLWRPFFRLPFVLRRWLMWDRLLGNPWRVKRMMGTVMVTSLATATRSSAWGVPYGIHPLIVGVGSVARKPGVAGDRVGAGDRTEARERVEPRDLLCLTVLFDHDVVDGVPVALFLKRLAQLMETAAFLSDRAEPAGTR